VQPERPLEQRELVVVRIYHVDPDHPLVARGTAGLDVGGIERRLFLQLPVAVDPARDHDGRA
jgi:hypothetical protein